MRLVKRVLHIACVGARLRPYEVGNLVVTPHRSGGKISQRIYLSSGIPRHIFALPDGSTAVHIYTSTHGTRSVASVVVREL